MAERDVADLGSRKLGEIFKYIAAKNDVKAFEGFLLSTIMMRGKPNDWVNSVSAIIRRLGRRALYMKYILVSAVNEFKNEVNINADRAALKRIVATIQAIRIFGNEGVGNRAITKVQERLEEKDFFHDR